MFKDKLKELREQKGISQYELADKIFVSRSTIAKWENGLGMPGKASMESLCEFFQISKEELLKEDDPEIIINNVQKRSKKIIIILLIALIPLLLYTLAFTIAYCVEMYEDTITPQDGKYYSEKYLKKFDLEGLDMIAGTNIQLFQNSFYADIESYEVFEDYVTYVYNRLHYSTTISYLSNERKIYDPINKRSDIFLIPSTDLHDHVDEIDDNGNPIKYEFYFFNDNTKRGNKDYVNFNYLELKYIDYTGMGNRFYMYLNRSSVDDDSYTKSYLVNEYFDIKKIELNNDNISSYLRCDTNNDNRSIEFYPYVTYVSGGMDGPIIEWMDNPNATPIPPFQLFVKVKFQLYKDDELIKEIEKTNLLQHYGGRVEVSLEELGIDSSNAYKYRVEYTYEVLENSYYYDIVKKVK